MGELHPSTCYALNLSTANQIPPLKFDILTVFGAAKTSATACQPYQSPHTSSPYATQWTTRRQPTSSTADFCKVCSNHMPTCTCAHVLQLTIKRQLSCQLTSMDDSQTEHRRAVQ
eukprot:jgi/Chrzof1/11625/Cz06g02210.t1